MPMARTARSPGESTWSQRSSFSTPTKNRERLLKPHNSEYTGDSIRQNTMSTIKSNSSQKSSSKRSTSSRRSRSQDNQFQIQHDNMMSRQQFRTNTSRSASRSRIPKEVNATASVHGNQSYDSGYSLISRQSEAIPQTINKPLFNQGQGGSRREEHVNNVKNIIAELNKAMDQERRMAAITNACAEFDHWDTEKHNIELHLGCSNVLCLVLSMTDNEDEIRMICAALEMVYRASTDSVRKTFQEVGPAVVPLLLKVLERCELSMLKNADVSILNISKVLLYFSRVSELRVQLAKHDGMFQALTRISTSALDPDARVLRMRVIANLSNSEDNKIIMIRHHGLVDSILKIAALDMSEGAREYASASLMDLASSSSTQEIMANNDRLLATLVKLAVADSKEETREYAVTAMQNLAFSKDNRTRLVKFSDGVVIEALKKSLSTDKNDKSRRRAAGALTNLACEDTADLMAGHEGLLQILSRVATQDKNNDVQKRSSLALTKIASSCSVDSSHSKVLMNALVTAASSPNSTGIPAVFRVKARDASIRVEMARIPGMLETLADMSTSKGYSSKDKENAMRCIMHLTNETENRKIVCNKVILNALVEASNLENAASKEIRDSAIVAIERLATEVSNRQYMARHDGLLVAIAKATERESKAELAGEKHSQPRLAKQLLLSLLVAM